jgi:hypothetical protein
VRRVAATPAVAAGVWFGWKGAALAAALALGGVALARRPQRASFASRATPAAPTTSPARPPRAPLVVESPMRAAAPSPAESPMRAATPSVTTSASPRSVPMPHVAPPRVVPPPPPRVVTPDTPVEPPAARAAAPAPPAQGGARAEPPPEDEPRTLERARAALRTDPAEALRIVEGGTAGERFIEERALIAMEAERRLDRTAALQARAAEFLRRFPRSLYAERVRRWVGP